MPGHARVRCSLVLGSTGLTRRSRCAAASIKLQVDSRARQAAIERRRLVNDRQSLIGALSASVSTISDLGASLQSCKDLVHFLSAQLGTVKSIIVTLTTANAELEEQMAAVRAEKDFLQNANGDLIGTHPYFSSTTRSYASRSRSRDVACSHIGARDSASSQGSVVMRHDRHRRLHQRGQR